MQHPVRLGAALAAFLTLSLQAAAEPGVDPYAGVVARTVRGIVEYARWPQRKDPVTLCVVGPAQHASQLGNWRTTDGRQVLRRNVAAQPAATAGCDALYIGSIPIAAQRQLTAGVRGRGVLTIAENDPSNASEAMFALTYASGTLSFRLNVDAVSRSGMKVDPRVLRLAKGGS